MSNAPPWLRHGSQRRKSALAGLIGGVVQKALEKNHAFGNKETPDANWLTALAVFDNPDI
jgi:hypothetical protein